MSNKKYPLSTIICITIWIICLIPVPETPLNKISFIDKWTHFVMYGSFTTAIWWEYSRNHKKSKRFQWKHLLLFGMLFPISMGCLVELAQAYLTTCRSGDWFDALCNALGTLLGCLIGILPVRYYAREDKDK